uniref:Uncharacterized protein n=1 Tax=Oryza sativa subsp. japonica TaxID=39947 RepID=Q7XE11_ORYSJ|nr:hypothetical protein LOC_Os10g30630 [Oryza sativa Japonica Group]
MRDLGVDPQTSDVTIYVVDPSVQMNMDDGEGPSAEVNETSVEEVNALEEGGVVAPVGIQPGGVADQGELSVPLWMKWRERILTTSV